MSAMEILLVILIIITVVTTFIIISVICIRKDKERKRNLMQRFHTIIMDDGKPKRKSDKIIRVD